jgi:hypothetical protein
MRRSGAGLTKIYGRFHDPEECAFDIGELRSRHAAMDRAVLDAYGWTDIQPTCEFILEYEDEDEEQVAGRPNRRRKPWRYRWPDEIRDEVLARLLALNAERASAELKGAKSKQPLGMKARKSAADGSTPLLD